MASRFGQYQGTVQAPPRLLSDGLTKSGVSSASSQGCALLGSMGVSLYEMLGG